MKTKRKRILLGAFLLLVIIPVLFLVAFYYQITRDTAKRIQKGAIQGVIASESPVFYDDGQTPIGVFFKTTHRQYVPYSDIPKDFVKAIVAAEDHDFFSHRGFEIKGILRALVANLKAGKVVQGGSTLTQQTAKNIFKREKRSYKAKLRELIQAFLLERRYTKREILEMYANQFFVTGFGKGLQIAAQYFFDKDAKDLDLVEAAFIAGSVKSPNRYNPFMQKTEAESQEAVKLANLRKDYVLKNMFNMHFITEDQYRRARAEEVPFNEGKITYRLNVILDYVRDQLESPFFKKILSDQGIDNIATSGIKVYTSINKEMQSAASESLRRHLPGLDVQLAGYDQQERQKEYLKLERLGILGVDPDGNLPFLARITHIDARDSRRTIIVSWKNGGGIINFEGLKPVAEAWLKWKYGEQAQFSGSQVPSFLTSFHKGDLVAVEWLSTGEPAEERELRLAVFPELEGGVVVLHEGMIKAMVGGFSNRYFNRAVDAKRQLGSIFKPIVYTAATQLKWSPLDPLMNVRDLFPFEKTYYCPRPDHEPENQTVSMAWAGAKSENLATVWLLYHLTDHLNMSEFRNVAHLLGLDRKQNESYLEYKRRIRDKEGVVVDRDALLEAAFEQAKKDVEPDIIFSGKEGILKTLNRLHYNIPLEARAQLGAGRSEILRHDFSRLSRLDLIMKRHWTDLVAALQDPGEKASPTKKLSLLRHFYWTLQNDGSSTKMVYTEDPDGLENVALLPVEPGQITGIDSLPNIDKIWIDDLLPSAMVDELQSNLTRDYKNLLTRNRYDLDVLFWIRDFRTVVNLSYVVHLAKEMGISTHLDPVLSFPLGANAISILEAAEAYQTIMTGNSFPLSDGSGSEQLVPIITKIVDRDGETIWAYKQKPATVVSRQSAESVQEILRKVIEIGTGRKARQAVRVEDNPLPAYGKTGTANRFTNSSFVGFIPGPDNPTGELELKKGYVVASYVGYDDNRPMTGRHFTIYGSSGALPLWIDTVNAIAESPQYLQAVDLETLNMNAAGGVPDCPQGLQPVPVSALTGLQTDLQKTTDTDNPVSFLCAPVDASGDTYQLKREFKPSGPSDDEAEAVE
jgi:penicillin-binding protein 1A